MIMVWLVVVIGKVGKVIKELPKEDAVAITTVIEQIKFNPFSGDIYKLSSIRWRRRMGNYRIFFEINKEEKIIYVVAVKRRTSTTYR